MTVQLAASVSPIRVGVSACLLGQRVRYDGGHKADPFIIETLGRYFCWVPVCPEMEIGLGTPRETLQLVGDVAAPSLVATVSGRDLTGPMQDFAAQRLPQLAELELHGYILKKNSPSCGMQGVRVYAPSGRPRRSGRGLFAQALMARWPRLPVAEEDRLQDPEMRAHFVERVYAYRSLARISGIESRAARHGAISRAEQVIAHGAQQAALPGARAPGGALRRGAGRGLSGRLRRPVHGRAQGHRRPARSTPTFCPTCKGISSGTWASPKRPS